LPEPSNVGPMNLKIIKQYQNVLHDYKKLYKKQCERTKILSYAKLIFVFSNVKDVF
jgi:hypothetical protein